MPCKAKQAQLPPELLPVLDIIAEMVADSMIKDMEEQAANRDAAPHVTSAKETSRTRRKFSGA